VVAPIDTRAVVAPIDARASATKPR